MLGDFNPWWTVASAPVTIAAGPAFQRICLTGITVAAPARYYWTLHLGTVAVYELDDASLEYVFA